MKYLLMTLSLIAGTMAAIHTSDLMLDAVDVIRAAEAYTP